MEAKWDLSLTLHGQSGKWGPPFASVSIEGDFRGWSFSAAWLVITSFFAIGVVLGLPAFAAVSFCSPELRPALLFVAVVVFRSQCF